MIAQILVSPNLQNRLGGIDKILKSQQLTHNHPDVFILSDQAKLGVTEAKKIREFLSLKPYSAQVKVIILESAHNLTIDAQNALLKTLEEPPGECIILLGVNNEDSLLPTILSRCQIIQVPNLNNQTSSDNQVNKYQKDIEKLFSLSIEEKFTYIEKLEEKGEFLQALVEYFHNTIYTTQHPSKHSNNLEFIKLLLQAQEWHKANVNIRTILEYLMLKLPSLSLAS